MLFFLHMEIKKIYRVQNADMAGYTKCRYEWRSTDASSYLEDGTERFMNPDADAYTPLALVCSHLKKGNPFLYGFANIQDLYTWFTPDELDNLSSYGFDIYEIEVPEYAIIFGSRQLIFHKNYILLSSLYCARAKNAESPVIARFSSF